ncbi:hypothetical protein ACPCHT_27505 [Nucisporomicrobium flavum]|uniref:hypothetical protein n=1 Tax=Nucisporomicrobium flavum TaxID=2785915 RepID=UPI0018F42353|nr:hypothetical protein [Nucisporomicrobium flavum]
MNLIATRGRASGGPSRRRPSPRRIVAAALTGCACALILTAGPATAKHCQTCEDKDAGLDGVTAKSRTASLSIATAVNSPGDTAALTGSDITRGQLSLDAARTATGPTALTWVRKTIFAAG